MNLGRIITFRRQNLSVLLLAVLLLFYIASGFTGKSFAYLMLVFVAALLYVGCGVLFYTTFTAAEKKGGQFRLLQLAYWLILASLFFYFVQIDAVWSKIAGDTPQTFHERLRQILQIFYFTGFAIVLVTLILSTAVKTEARGRDAGADNRRWTARSGGGTQLLGAYSSGFSRHDADAPVFALSRQPRAAARSRR
jgi:hypothetical protein